MYALQLASGKPSALGGLEQQLRRRSATSACSSTAATGRRASCPDTPIGTAPILGTTLGEENTYGAMAGRTPSGPVTFARVSTDDVNGAIRAYVGEGALHRRRARHVWHAAPWSRCRAAEADAVHLQERLRTPRLDERLAHRARSGRGILHQYFGLGTCTRTKGDIEASPWLAAPNLRLAKFACGEPRAIYLFYPWLF